MVSPSKFFPHPHVQREGLINVVLTNNEAFNRTILEPSTHILAFETSYSNWYSLVLTLYMVVVSFLFFRFFVRIRE